MKNPVILLAAVMGLLLIGLILGVVLMDDGTGGKAQKKRQSNRGMPSDSEPGKMLNAAHILICHNESKSPADRTKDEALKIALEVVELARKDISKFGELAIVYSEGPSGPDGGNLNNFSPGSMVAPFSSAVLDLEIGEVSDPVATQFGYHVILRKELN